MSTVEKPTGVRTHEVTNQPPPLVDYNVFDTDRVMGEAVRREGAEWAVEKISAVGEIAGRADVIELGRLANENPPKLRTHDRYGNRIDEPEFHPAWHELMRLGISHELHSLPGASLSLAPTSPGPPRSCASHRPRPASAARSR